MADDLEKFVIEYKVELKDSLDRLEQLQKKIDKTSNQTKNVDKFKGAFNDITNELKPLLGDMSLMDSALLRIGYRIAWMAPILAGLAVAVKSVVDVRKEYEAQRKLAYESGMSPLQVEQFQRQANTASGGIVGAQGARDIVQKTSNLALSSYTNPDVMSRESLILQRLGTSAFDKSGNIKGTEQILDEISAKMRSVTKEQAVAMGSIAGFSADEVRAIRGRTEAVKESTKISEQEENKLRQQAQSLEVIRNSLGKTQEAWRRIELIIASSIMPVVEDLITNTADEVELIKTMFDTMSERWAEFVEDFKWGLQHPFATFAETQEAKLGRVLEKAGQNQEDINNKQNRETDKQFQESRNAQALFTRDINLFSSAVSTFAGVIDERQAWAAWAGEIGRAAGVGPNQGMAALPTGATESSAVADNPVNPAIYDEIFNSEAAKYKDVGLTPDLLKAITRVESNFNPNAVSNADAHGLMQIISKNNKGLGITNPYDPRQNIAGGAQLMAEYLRASKGDLRTALTMYHGGYDKSGWGPLTKAYPEKVMKALENIKNIESQAGSGNLQAVNGGKRVGVYDTINSSRPAGAAPYPLATTGVDLATVKMPAGRTAPVAGQGRENVQLRGVQEAIAGYLGVPVEQVMQGFVNKGDVEFARKYLEMGTNRDYIKNVELSKMPGVRPNVAAEAAKNARSAAFQLNAFQKYGQQMEDKARPGGRDITVGQKEVTINVIGNNDPRATAEATREALLRDDVNDINNMTAMPYKW